MKKYNKQICFIVAFALLLAGTFMTLPSSKEVAFAAEDKSEIDDAVQNITQALGDGYSPLELATPNTIYVIQDADGTANKMIQLNDAKEFDYLDVQTTERPIEVSITYTLDGKTVTADEIAGKSGKVSIRFDYVNNETQSVEVDGETTEMKIPYVAISGVILNNDNFSNVEVVNGRAVDDGSRVIAAGIALPGMKESLDPESKISSLSNVPDYIEITADATDFNFSMTVTAALPLNDDKIDLSEFSDLSNVSSKLNLLTSAMTELTSGSEELAVATNDLDTGMGNLASAIGSLDFGLSTISANSDALRSGDEEVFNSMLSTVQSQLVEAGLECPELTIENYDEALEQIIESLSDDNIYSKVLAGVTEQVEANRSDIVTGVTAAVRSEVETQVKPAVEAQVKTTVVTGAGFDSSEAYDAAVALGQVPGATQQLIENAISTGVDTALPSAVDAQMQSETVQGIISVNVETKIQSLIDDQMQSEAVQTILTNSYATAKAGREKVQAAKDQLDSYNVFHKGVNSYTSGVDSASSGSSQISSGSSQIKSGTSQISSGMSSLSDGIDQLNEDGISKIVDLLSGDIFDIIKRAEKLVALGKEADPHVYVMRSASVGK